MARNEEPNVRALVSLVSVKAGPGTKRREGEKPERRKAEPVKIWKARAFIDEHCGEHLSLPKVARTVNTSANYLSEKFNEVTGVKFVDYIARARFEKACRLLPDVDLRVSEIAFAVGFQSLSQFNRVFRRFSGKSPSEYRRMKRTNRREGGICNVAN